MKTMINTCIYDVLLNQFYTTWNCNALLLVEENTNGKIDIFKPFN